MSYWAWRNPERWPLSCEVIFQKIFAEKISFICKITRWRNISILRCIGNVRACEYKVAGFHNEITPFF